MKKKVGIITLHLNFGGVELASVNLANMLKDEYDVTIINMYESIIPYNIGKEIKIENLSNLKPNKSEFKNAVKSKNIFNIINEGIKAVKILYLRTELVKKHLLENDYDILISSRILYTNLINKLNISAKKIAIEHRHHNNDEKYINSLKEASNKIDCLVCVSKELTEFYKNRFNINCKYIPNSLENFPEEKDIDILKKENIIIAVRKI